MGCSVTDVHPNRLVRIVIVDDDPASRKVMVWALQADQDFVVAAEFAEGAAAVAAIRNLLPDVVLIDLGLPDICGIEVIEKTKQICPECDILVVTALADERSVTSALEAGADGYLLKGTRIQELRDDIRCLRNGGSPLSPPVARQLLNKLQCKTANDRVPIGGSAKLTRRERDILEMIAKGFSYFETSQICGVASATVHSHLKSIYRKLEVHSKTEAVHEARRLSLI
jgi:DNA-binding NarL/FixJ family response regulator